MFLRFTSRTNADGAVVRYVALAHNRRVDGRVKPDVLMSLGRVDQVDVAGLRRLAASINRHFGGADQPTGAAPAEVVSVRTVGAIWLLDGVWHRLCVGAAVRAAVGPRRFTATLERVLFALVAHRAVDPPSGLPAAEWVRDETAVPGLSTMDDEQARRVLDLLEDADTRARVRKSLFSPAIEVACDDGEQTVIGLALLLTRVAEHACGQPWRTINRQLGRVAQVTLAGPAGTVTQTTPLDPEQTAVYQALSIQPPARVTASAPGRRAARGRSR